MVHRETIHAQMASSVQQTLTTAIRARLALQGIREVALSAIVQDAGGSHDGGDQRWMVDDVVVQTVQACQVRLAPSAVVGTENAGQVLSLGVELGTVGRAGLVGLTVGCGIVEKNAGWIGEGALRAIARAISGKDLAQGIIPHTNLIRTSKGPIVVVGDGLDVLLSRTSAEALTLVEHPS